MIKRIGTTQQHRKQIEKHWTIQCLQLYLIRETTPQRLSNYTKRATHTSLLMPFNIFISRYSNSILVFKTYTNTKKNQENKIQF